MIPRGVELPSGWWPPYSGAGDGALGGLLMDPQALMSLPGCGVGPSGGCWLPLASTSLLITIDVCRYL